MTNNDFNVTRPMKARKSVFLQRPPFNEAPKHAGNKKRLSLATYAFTFFDLGLIGDLSLLDV